MHTPSLQEALAAVHASAPIRAFYILQCVIYGAVSMSKQAKANSPGESPQMHTESSP